MADYFDTHGRLIERRTRQDVSQPVLDNLGPDSGQRHYSHRWAYDTRFGRVLAESWPNGVGRSFVYSSIGAVEAELGLGDAMPLTLREVREVNALGQATVEWLGAPGEHGALRIQRSQTQATGEMESIQYARRAMGGATPATIWHETYRYDGWGNLIRRAQSQPDLPAEGGSFSQFERYQYDALHRLTQSTLTTNGASATPVSLAYDKVGNLLKKTDFSRDLGNAYSYPAANGVQPNAVQSVALAGGSSNTQNYRYDASGNVVCQFLLNNTVRSCTDLDAFRAYYNHNQQPVYQRRTLVHSVNGSLYSDAWFTYGADQQPARQWGFEGTPDCINQPADRGCLRHHRIYLDRYEDTVGSFRHFDGGERLYRSRAYVGDYLVATRGRYGELELSFLLRDRLGSVVGVEGVTLEQRNIKILRAETRHSFDAYGTPRSNFKRDGSGWVSQDRWSAPTRTQQGFTGHERLSGLQLIHMRGRVFDPQLGRFHGVDPIIQFPLSSQGLNPYSYILNNPLAGVDPTGYAVCSDVSTTKAGSGTCEFTNSQGKTVSVAYAVGTQGKLAIGPTSNPGAVSAAVSFGVERSNGANRGQSALRVAGVQERSGSSDMMSLSSRTGTQCLDGKSGGCHEGSTLATSASLDPPRASKITEFGVSLTGVGGTAISIFELIFAESPLSGDEASRGWAAVGLIPWVRTLKYVDEVAEQQRAYSVMVEIRLAKNGRGDRSSHFRDANEQLDAMMRSDNVFAESMRAFGVSIPVSSSGRILGESPPGWTWHHAVDRPGVLQLVPREQHKPGSAWQHLLHPNRVGGFKQWGSEY